MDNCEARNTGNFEEMEGLEYQWLCSGLPSLKRASKSLGVHGIILSLLLLVLNVGVITGYHLIPGLRSASYFGLPTSTWVFVFGAVSFVVGALLYSHSLVLLGHVLNNQGFQVFKMIKVGCLTLIYTKLILMLIIFIGIVILLADQRSHPTQIVVGMIWFWFLIIYLLLTAIAIYAIHSVKPKIFSLYVDITVFFCFLIATCFVISVFFLVVVALFGEDLGGFPAYLRGVGAAIFESFPLKTAVILLNLIVVSILFYSIVVYYLKIIVLHLNMMVITPVQNNLHNQLNV